MNKKEFIKVLEEKLSVLDEEELKDIINEYKDTIDEKVKHGQTEEEAVADFGSIDELTKEILKAYKINPKYGEKKDNVKEVLNDCESLIKKGARALANFSKSVYDYFKSSDNNLTVELIFEILIKVIILLILLAILRLPFELINHLGRSILNVSFYPLDEILIFIWSVILFLLYFVCCILIAIAMFKQYFKNVEEKPIKKKVNNKKDLKEVKKIEIKEENNSIKNDNVTNAVGKVLKVIFQVFIVIVCLIPLWFSLLAILLVLILSIYYLFIGINTIGILISSIGLLILFSYTSSIFNNIAFNHKKVHFAPFIVSLVFIAIGVLLTVDALLRINYIDEVPDGEFNYKTEVFELTINKLTEIDDYHNIEYIIDDSIEDNKIKIEISHFEDMTKIDYYQSEEFEYSEYTNYIGLYSYDKNGYNNGWKIYNIIINNLKKNKFYRYDSLYDYSVKVYSNEKTQKLLKID